MKKTIQDSVGHCFARILGAYSRFLKYTQQQQHSRESLLRIRYYRKQRLKQILLLFILFSLQATANGQVKPLKIGDDIISLKIKSIIYASNDSLNLKDYRGKVIVLDFWSIYCGSCIQHMPEIKKLGEQLKDSLLLLPVTADSKDKVIKAFQTNPILKETLLATAVGDVKLKQLFPHDLVPHLVWIDPKGKYIGTTDIAYLTPENIRKVWNGEVPHWEIKTDKDLINLQQSSLHDFFNQDTTKHFLPYLPGESSQSGMVLQADSSIRFYMVNTSMARQYAVATSFEGLPLEPKRREIELQDSLAYEYQAKAAYPNDWAKKYSYSYERILPKGTSISQRNHLLLQDLNTHFKSNGQIEQKLQNVWVLQQTEPKPGYPLSPTNGIRLNDWLAEVNHVSGLKWVIDESGLDKATLLPPLPKVINFETLNQTLIPAGLRLQATERKLPVFTLTPKLKP